MGKSVLAKDEPFSHTVPSLHIGSHPHIWRKINRIEQLNFFFSFQKEEEEEISGCAAKSISTSTYMITFLEGEHL